MIDVRVGVVVAVRSRTCWRHRLVVGVRHLFAITHRLRRMLAPLPADRHARRRLLLAGRRDVTHDVVGSRDADDLLRGGNVVRNVTGEDKSFLRGVGRAHRNCTPGCLYRRRTAANNKSPRFPGE